MTPQSTHGAAADSAPQAIDRAVIQQLASALGDQGVAVMPALIRTFIESGDALLASARVAIGRDDRPTMRRAMHTLKSNANTFGARALEALCRDLERRAADGGLSDAGAALDEVAAELALVRAALEAL
ncbi:Hpt domain-containing protein [Oscillochloris sp. ZM17-4]|uniref:Hpt domain-containing protein n=1 Tax=Oscillochloris sp. ZM17-4 TaxID=2866714 RepID=UPI001C7320CA|nr:Hpt domain-containing protein [Oscillochloris sp. ZM17-4]MBX0328105.1 Hpt domain-containing protein [Oscillochloris sp. ZM17-4]